MGCGSKNISILYYYPTKSQNEISHDTIWLSNLTNRVISLTRTKASLQVQKVLPY